MSPTLNHTIVWCRDKEASARYLTETLGLPTAQAWGPFMVVEMGNDVSLDFYDLPHRPDAEDDAIASQHYAFLVSEEEFDQIFGRIEGRGQDYWADPALSQAGRVNHDHGGRGVYFLDPDGHVLEIITAPYGSG